MPPLTLNIANLSLPLNSPLTVTREPLDDTNPAAGTREIWRLTGELRAATPDALAQARTQLETALSGTLAHPTIKRGDSLIRAFPAAGLRHAPRATSLRFDAAETAAAKCVSRFTLTLEATFDAEDAIPTLPAGVADGAVTTTLRRGPDGAMRRIVEGFFTGPFASQRARELRPLAALIEDSVSDNPVKQRSDFRYVSLVSGPLHGEPAHSNETISIEEKLAIIEHHPLAPGAPIYRQVAGAPSIRVIQEGTASAATRHPSPPQPLYPDCVIERSVRYSHHDPDTLQAGSAPRETRWRFVCAPNETPNTPQS